MSKNKLRYHFTIAYDGASYSGWQSQPGGNTVQDIVEARFAQILGEPIRIHAAGRTDAGVHALDQHFHVDLLEDRFPFDKWLPALNGGLPPQIRILDVEVAPSKFHARFSVSKKNYRYTICNSRVLPPHHSGRAWLVPAMLDTATMREAAYQFVGTHDFARFAANRGDSLPEGKTLNTIRTIYEVRLTSEGNLIHIEFIGEGFLYKMVRMLTGAIMHCGAQRSTTAEVATYLTAPGPKWNYPAPAEGLFLVKTFY